MKITRVRTHLLSVPLGRATFYSSQAAFPARKTLLVEVTDENGLSGWGEAGQYGPAAPVAAAIDKVLAPIIVDCDDVQPGPLWERLYSMHRDFGTKGPYIEALSGIDIALHDLWGKRLGLPVAELLGGAFRPAVAAYATGCYYRGTDFSKDAVSSAAEEAQSFVAAGFTALKMKIGLFRIEQDARRVHAVREAIGPSIALMVDANHAYSSSAALRMGRHLEEAAVGWLEEPVTPEDRSGYRLLRQRLDVPIAGGEAEYTRFGFRDLLVEQCVDIIQPDLSVCGGFTEFARIQALASAHGVSVVPHVWGSGVALAAALHAAATIPPHPYGVLEKPLENAPALEYDRSPNPLRDELTIGVPALVDGFVPIPTAPGLGIEIDPEVLEKYVGDKG